MKPVKMPVALPVSVRVTVSPSIETVTVSGVAPSMFSSLSVRVMESVEGTVALETEREAVWTILPVPSVMVPRFVMDAVVAVRVRVVRSSQDELSRVRDEETTRLAPRVMAEGLA